MKGKNTIAIIHFQPLELYPPIINVIDYLNENNDYNRVYIYTTYKNKKLLQFSKVLSSKIEIKTVLRTTNSHSTIFKLAYYTYFNVFVFLDMLFKLPKTVLYYETISALPALWFKQLFKKKNVGVHYHEYTTKKEYNESSSYIKYIHNKEVANYQKLNWVSHTNDYRMKLFENDNPTVNWNKKMIFPNYPSVAWSKYKKVDKEGDSIKLIYVGALDMDTMFVEETLNWLQTQKNVTIDFYSNIVTQKTKELLLKYDFVQFFNGIPYHELPKVLVQYDVGLVFYKGLVENYVFNAPNKLFEYLACGLDVLLTTKLKGALTYATSETYPVVKFLDFENLENSNIYQLVSKSGLTKKESTYFCENEIANYFNQIR